jgi:DUF1680 family protein
MFDCLCCSCCCCCRLREALYNHAAGKFRGKDFQGAVKFFAATLEVCEVSRCCQHCMCCGPSSYHMLHVVHSTIWPTSAASACTDMQAGSTAAS